MTDLYDKLSNCHPSILRGRVWCTVCGKTKLVDARKSLLGGWEKCCGYTMTIDSPEEREILSKEDIDE